jgi:HPt (histidine-containing phosphotransfer) domain-containing protein
MIIDPRVIYASMGHDPKFIREAAADFLSGARADIANITQAISATDTEGVRVGSHRVKGASAIFGANDLNHVCTELESAFVQSWHESAARDIDWNKIQALMPKLILCMGEVEVAIEEFLERLQ